jgi:glutamate racemase
MSNSPIGIFDSGIGGTTIWRELKKILPNEQTIYVGDSLNAPYGNKTREEIQQLSAAATNYLLEQECKIIVVACNTATTNAIKLLRNSYNVPFIGIEPAIKLAALKTQTNTVGVLATKGTLASELFHKTSETYADGIKVIEQEGKGLVQLIEEGKINSEETLQLLSKYIAPMVEAGVDSLVLGCTHYPYLIPQIKKLAPQTLQIIDSGEAVAKQTKAVLEQENLLSEEVKPAKNDIFYTTGEVALLKSFLTDVNNVNVKHLKL